MEAILLTSIGIISVLVFALVHKIQAGKNLTARLAEAESRYGQLSAAVTDEDLEATVRSLAETSPLAKKMLSAASEVPDAWRHSNDVSTPCEAHWETVLADFRLEKTDDDRARCIGRIIDRGDRITYHEQRLLAAEMETPEGRDQLRALFSSRKPEKTPHAWMYYFHHDGTSYWCLGIDRFASEDEARGSAYARAQEELVKEKIDIVKENVRIRVSTCALTDTPPTAQKPDMKVVK